MLASASNLLATERSDRCTPHPQTPPKDHARPQAHGRTPPHSLQPDPNQSWDGGNQGNGRLTAADGQDAARVPCVCLAALLPLPLLRAAVAGVPRGRNRRRRVHFSAARRELHRREGPHGRGGAVGARRLPAAGTYRRRCRRTRAHPHAGARLGGLHAEAAVGEAEPWRAGQRQCGRAGACRVGRRGEHRLHQQQPRGAAPRRRYRLCHRPAHAHPRTRATAGSGDGHPASGQDGAVGRSSPHGALYLGFLVEVEWLLSPTTDSSSD